MGANVIRGGTLAPAWRENTLRSFQAAAASGACFVEFDVQVTADGVPVVWHDDTVEFGDPSRPSQVAVSELTAAEFQALGALSASGKCQQLSVVRRFKHAAAAAAAASAAAASPEARLAAALASAGEDDSSSSTAAAAAPQRRRWCCEVDDAFPTLEQLFSALPGHLAFNIEVKMATPPEVAVTPAAEIQRMVGPILEVVARCTGAGRQVVFSSFDPDVCAALRQGQGDHQVLFLSTGGRDWHADARRMSLAAAVAEAAASQLSGVVVDSGALHAAPEVVAQARANGLKLLTYGLENDTLAWVLQQQQLGVTGVIVDDLEGLMTALRSGGAAAAVGAAAPTAAVARADAAAAAAAAAVVEGLVGQVAVQAVSSAAAAVSQAQAAAPLPQAVVAT
jgi:glycerophosphodiester phosphodiesterase